MSAVSGVQVLALVLGILIFIALVFAVVLALVGRRAGRMRAELERGLGAPPKRAANAQGLGLESRGKGQVRGNGWLVLTDDELLFRQWVPDRETRIPLAAVTAVETPRGWLGKSVGSRLLCVRWRTEDGGGDAMAWNVRDREEWVRQIDAARGAARWAG
jgi:hypothetical protein